MTTQIMKRKKHTGWKKIELCCCGCSGSSGNRQEEEDVQEVVELLKEVALKLSKWIDEVVRENNKKFRGVRSCVLIRERLLDIDAC